MRTEIDIALVRSGLVVRENKNMKDKEKMKLIFDLLTCHRPWEVNDVTEKWILKDDVPVDIRKVLKSLRNICIASGSL